MRRELRNLLTALAAPAPAEQPFLLAAENQVIPINQACSSAKMNNLRAVMR